MQNLPRKLNLLNKSVFINLTDGNIADLSSNIMLRKKTQLIKFSCAQAGLSVV